MGVSPTVADASGAIRRDVPAAGSALTPPKYRASTLHGVASIDDAITALTDPANVSQLGHSGPRRRFAVKQKRIIARLRDMGAGKAEARTLALQGLEKVGGEVIEGANRGGVPGRHTESVENWVIPPDAIRWDAPGESPESS